MNVERFVPLGPRRTRVVYTYFFADLGPGATARNEDVVRMSTVTLEQDRRICEAVQRNLEAGTYDVGRLSPRHENGVFHLQERVRAAVATV
jgi:choline monooxygenase